MKYFQQLLILLNHSVNTSVSSIYKINYFVIDNEGNANTTVLNVIVEDITQPSINLPSNNKISTSTMNVNLLEGVSCTDNSGFCDITYTGSITYGVAGKYVIEYTAQDPSGNTTISRRVITVE